MKKNNAFNNVIFLTRIFLTGAFFAYSVLAAGLFFMQERYIYNPSSIIKATPVQEGISYEDVTFSTEDGINIHAWFVPVDNSRGTVLFCKGNYYNISDLLPTIRVFRRMGYSALFFDYRGYGESSGQPSEAGTYRDSEAAWSYLTGVRGCEPSQIVVFGRSLGGPVAAKLASIHNPGGLVLESTFTSMPDLAADAYPLLPARKLARFNYNTMDFVSRVQCPVYIIHSPDDEKIPFDHGLALYESAPGEKSMLVIGGNHYDGFLLDLDHYVHGLESFFQSAIVPGA
ncbi:MAG: alpha/beta hydrolase [Candidatus Wallbacteria bacterium]|nr:alpha/beta hydrolase [Candidatus Wallbacteria bacterium]